MLVSVLYDVHGRLVAAAPACDQIPHGEQYWNDLPKLPAPRSSLGPTSVHNVTDPDLVSRMLDVADHPERLVAVRRDWQTWQNQIARVPRPASQRFPEGCKPGSKIVNPRVA